MTEVITWSLTAGSTSGGAVNVAGMTPGDGTVSVSVTLDPAMAAPRDLALQVDDASKVTFLAISSTLNDGTVEVTPSGGSAVALTGPLLMVGAAVALFSANLGTLGVQNTSPDKTATVTVLVGLTL